MKICAAALASFALALSAIGCASATGAVPKPFPMAGSATARPHATSADGLPGSPVLPEPLLETSGVVGTALQLRGAPYRNGGGDPLGFDCSGFTQYVFAQHHIALPRDVETQYRVGTGVQLGDIAPGDLLFFSTIARGPSHVAIAIGQDEFVHAPSSNGVVRVEHLSASYWAQRYLGARRITRP